MTSEIDKLKHFHIENYSGTNFTDDLNDGTCQNRRKSNVFKEPNGSIHYNGAFTKRATSRYSFATKEWTENKNPICWSGGLFEHKDNVLTGRYFSICLLQQHDINKGWMPKPTQIIDCVEASYKYHTDKMTASDYTHLFGYLNPYYRSAYNIPKRRK